eukprot:CAMPEP_0181189884 /NCGR_PEP_ID=MMETSP1096-20121128/11900_1 /TAXON_ID=156174 ORGANISM="Chrysochromulina ericina, Strain CCMP281" /NCGR_SAMPLE_ID=MMETSP1096 /ASSEMBLY_ACC=CAM_ASM_000453 /LENGTH=38 /DNA_ID= /DNA_START= /DNA_END= /DNA_ORIENTATION=
MGSHAAFARSFEHGLCIFSGIDQSNLLDLGERDKKVML